MQTARVIFNSIENSKSTRYRNIFYMRFATTYKRYHNEDKSLTVCYISLETHQGRVTDVCNDKHSHDRSIIWTTAGLLSIWGTNCCETGIKISTVYSDADQRKHQSSASLVFVRGIHRGLVNSPRKWPVTRKMFPFDDVIMSSRGICKSSESFSSTKKDLIAYTLSVLACDILHKYICMFS